MKRTLGLTLAVLALTAATALAAPLPATPHARPAPMHAPTVQPSAQQPDSVGVIVKFQKPATAAPAAKLLSALDGSTASPSNPQQGIYAFSAPEGQTDSDYALQLMLQAPGVAYAEPNYVRHPAVYVSPTDPDFTDTTTYTDGVGDYPGGKHWWLGEMNAVPAWQMGQGSSYPTHGSAGDIKVADIDVGAFLTHPEFNGGTVVAGTDECTSFNPITDTFGPPDNIVTPDATADLDFESHGTATAAAVGAEINGVGMVGIGYNPQVVCYKCAGPVTVAGDGYTVGDIVILDSQIALCIDDAVNAGCKIINMSLAGPDYSQTLQDAITYAHSHGVVVCASVGNDGNTTVNYPAACTYAVGVGAIALKGGSVTTTGTPIRAAFSDYAPGVVDLTAPGQVFWSADMPGYDSDGTGTVSVPGYQFWAGTSFSSPAAAGAIAYLWRAMPDLSNDQIVSYVESSTVDLGTAGRDDQFGYGLVNMQAAYNKLIADYPMLAKPTVSTPAYSGGHQAAISWNAVSGYNVNYQVFVDNVLRSTQTSTSVVATSLADGSHTVSVVPTSTRNWNTTSASVTKTFTEDSVAPVVSNFAWNGTTLSWSVAETNPYTVQAYVDTATPAVVASNTLSPGALFPGNHTLYVNATDGAGNSSGWVPWDFTVALNPPVLSSIVVTDALSATVSWPVVPGVDSYDYQVNGGSVLSTSGPGFALSGLTGGVTPIAVRSVFSGQQSAWATATVTDVVVVPATPSPSAPATVGVPSVTVNWPAAAHALSYEYRLNGGSSIPTTAVSVTIPGLPLGANAVSVRALDNLAQSAWATASVTYAVPAPVPSVPATVWAPTATVSWPPVAGASAYEYAVNSGSVLSTGATSVIATGLVYGPNSITVRTVQGANRSSWATATVTYPAPAATVLTLSPSASAVRFPSTSVTLSAHANAPTETIGLQSSTDGVTWNDTGESFTTTATPAAVSLPVTIATTTAYRLNFAGDAHWAPAVSAVTTVTYDPTVIPPVLSSIVVTDALSVDVSWVAVPYASSYDYQVNGGSVLSTSGPGFTLSGLTSGATPIAARAVISGQQSVWVTATVTDNVVVPATPVISAPTTTSVSSVAVSWSAAAGAKWYEYRVNGGTATVTSATGVLLGGLHNGPTTFEVRGADNLAYSSWATATVNYTGPTATALTLSASPSMLVYPATALTLTGLVNAPSAPVALQSSIDGGRTWNPTAISWTSTAAPAPVTMATTMQRTTYYQLVFGGEPDWTPAISNIVAVSYAAYLKTPSAPSSVRHAKRFTASLTVLAPARASGASVSLKFYRYQKSGSKYAWVFKKSVRATAVTSKGNATTYRASLSLSKTGKYRLIASYWGNGVYSSSTSVARALRVK